jgi:hypothetical protein
MSIGVAAIYYGRPGKPSLSTFSLASPDLEFVKLPGDRGVPIAQRGRVRGVPTVMEAVVGKGIE